MTTKNPGRSTNRLDWASRASAIGILLVVFGHSTFKELAEERGDVFQHVLQQIVDFVYTFHMPLFFFISGLLFSHTTRESGPVPSGKFLWIKVWRLLLPYAAVSSCAFPIKALLAKDALHPVAFTPAAYVHTLIYPWNNTIIFFWFLVTLFLMFLTAPLLRWLLARLGVFGSGIIFGLLVWTYTVTTHGSPEDSTLLNWQGAAHNLIYFFVGMILPVTMIAVAQRPRWQLFTLSAATLALMLFAYWHMQCDSPILPLAMGLLGTLAVVLSAMGSLGWLSKFWAPLETYSFQIYLLSWFPQQVVKMLAKRITTAPLSAWSLASLLAGLLVPILVAGLIKRWKVPAATSVLGM
jgi:fucose 4-O-acetylase-like acetyltransferase